MACWPHCKLLSLIARPRSDQMELITVGTGGYGPTSRGILLVMYVNDVIDDRSGHTHTHTKQRRQRASLLDEYVKTYAASGMPRRMNQLMVLFFHPAQ